MDTLEIVKPRGGNKETVRLRLGVERSITFLRQHQFKNKALEDMAKQKGLQLLEVLSVLLPLQELN